MKISEVKKLVEAEGKIFSEPFWDSMVTSKTTEEIIKKYGDIEVERLGEYHFSILNNKFSGWASKGN